MRYRVVTPEGFELYESVNLDDCVPYAHVNAIQSGNKIVILNRSGTIVATTTATGNHAVTVFADGRKIDTLTPVQEQTARYLREQIRVLESSLNPLTPPGS